MNAPMPGAPYQIGDLVEVVAAIDCQIHDVSEHIGKSGRVRRLDYDAPGAIFPTGPMLHVELADGPQDFWPEELGPAPSKLATCQGDVLVAVWDAEGAAP